MFVDGRLQSRRNAGEHGPREVLAMLPNLLNSNGTFEDIAAPRALSCGRRTMPMHSRSTWARDIRPYDKRCDNDTE